MATETEIETWQTDPDAAYVEVERRIAEAKEVESLDLFEKGKGPLALTILPPAIASLTSLRWLTLDKIAISDLTPLSGLTRLQTLSLNGTAIRDLAPLAGLTALQTLALDGTEIADLSTLANLTNLRSLRINRTGVSDLTPLVGLTHLRALKLKDTQVADLSPLAALSKSLIAGAKRGKGNGLDYANTPAATALAHLAALSQPDRTIETLASLSQ